MNISTIPILAALFIQLVFGLGVFQANRHRKANQAFLFLFLVAAGWLYGLYAVLTARSPLVAAFWIRQASVFGVLLLTVFNLLRLSIKDGERPWPQILRKSWLWIVASVAVTAFCQTKFFVQGAHLSRATGSFVPVYRNFQPYLFYFAIAGAVLITSYII